MTKRRMFKINRSFGRSSPSAADRAAVNRSASLSVTLWLGIVMAVFAQSGSQAQPTAGVLPFSDSFLLTGNYVVGSVDLNEEAHPIVDGFSTGTIPMSGVPANADIVAAYLFWETITVQTAPEQAAGVKFRGFDIDINSELTVKRTSVPLTGSTTPCWSSGVPLVMHMFRADVLRFLPIRADVNDEPTGKRLVNSADLAAHGESPHTVTLPVRTGNEIPESAGGALMVVYRDPTDPLRKIVVYDGTFIKPALNVPMVQSLQGFYQSAAVKSAKVTHISGFGQPNQNDKILFNGTQILADSFTSANASQRGWISTMTDVSSLMSANTPVAGYGETATTSVVHNPSNGGYDCLSWGAVVFSTSVADVDNDGLPDGLEDASGVLKDPDDTPLPNLDAMGAGSDQPDLFVEFNAMRAAPGTSYGSANAPYSATETTRTDTAGHHHFPTPADLKMLGDAYQAKGIRPHFDVGPHADYHALGIVNHSDWVDDYTLDIADAYLIPSGLSRGGEEIAETACVPTSTANCHFPDFPGTVNWKLGFQILRDSPVGDGGEQLTTAQELFDWLTAGGTRRRFDPERKSLFHYVLYAHALGRPKSIYPCLVNGVPGPFDSNEGTACTTPNLEFHVPTSQSGIAHLPGGSAMVTLGFWTEYVGRPFVRASTTFHELGHNFDLWHGGVRPIWGNKAAATATYFEPTCKPNYLSSMSYSFVAHGLFTNDDVRHLDYSGTVHSALSESPSLADAPLSPSPLYRTAWFAPAGSALAITQGASPATRFCSGVKFDLSSPPAPMARVLGATTVAAIDWNGDTLTNSGLSDQDVNFDDTVNDVADVPPTALQGYNDWANIRLNQIGAAEDGVVIGSAENIGVWLTEPGSIFFQDGSIFFQDGSIFWQDGSIFFQDGSIFFQDGSIFFQDGSIFFQDGSVEAEDINYDTVNGIGKGRASQFTANVIGANAPCSTLKPDASCHRVELRFTAPPFGDFVYHYERKRADQLDNAFVQVGTSTTNYFVDPTELAQGVAYVYRMRGVAADGNTPWVYTIPGTVTGVNDAPAASPDGIYQVNNKGVLNVAAPGILANDADGDSPQAFRARRAVLVSGPTTGTLACGNTQGVICADGSFKYTPPKGGSFTGLVTFMYKSDSGLSGVTGTDPAQPPVPLSPFSSNVTVTINVFK